MVQRAGRAAAGAHEALLALALPDPPEGPPHYLLIDDVLGRSADELLGRVVAREGDFFENDPGRLGYRRGRALDRAPELTEPVAAAARDRLDDWARHFEVDTGSAPALDALELADLAVTAFGEGDFLSQHRDDGRRSHPNGRVLSFVYWFFARPRRFDGGELRLCGWIRHEGELMPGPPAIDLEPRHDAMVVFPSSTMHEVFPVQGSGLDFGDGRFAVTGFVRRRSEH